MSSPSSSAVGCSMKKKKKSKKTIYLCDDVLYDIFPNVGNVQTGLDMALVSNNYDAVVDNYFKIKKRKLGRRLWIKKAVKPSKKMKKSGNISELVADGEKVPFADIPPPKEILGFKSITISCVDANALAFLAKFRPLFEKGIAFKCSGARYKKEFRKIWPLFRNNIVKMLLTDWFLVFLRCLFGPTVLRKCANLRFVNAEGINLEGVPSDTAEASTGKALLQWQYTAREDGRPKMLTVDVIPNKDQIDGFKKEFCNATSAVSFIVRFFTVQFHNEESGWLKQFELTNERTDERLTLRSMEDNDRKDMTLSVMLWTAKFEIWVLERGPIKREEKLWTEWANEGPFCINTDYWEAYNVVDVNLANH